MDIGCIYGANRFNVGLLVWAGRRGGGGLALGSSDGVAAAPARGTLHAFP